MGPAPSLPDWPLFGMVDDVRPALAEAQAAGRPGALATLYAVVGGSPRPVGSQMLVVDGALHGFLSGGCIEADVAAHAERVLDCGRPERLVYGDGGPPDIRLVCGGRIELLVEAVAPDDPAALALTAAWRSRRPAIWASDGVERLCWSGAPGLGAGAAALAAGALQDDPAAIGARVDGGLALAFRRNPARRMVVVGADPTTLAIARLAVESGFDTHLVRPKGPAEPPPVPGVRYHREEADAVIGALQPDGWTYVAVCTHSLEDDEAALVAALASPAPYVGALGARRRLPERLARLRALGVEEAALGRLHAPIGLDLGGKAPFEIAVSVLAEVLADANGRQPQAMVEVGGGVAAARRGAAA